MKKLTIAILFLCVSLVMSQTNPTGTLSGMVIDDRLGAPLANAAVLIEGTGLGAYTDNDGYFTIPDIPVGKYSVRVDLVGHKSRIIDEVLITSDRRENITVELTQTAIEMEGIESIPGYFDETKSETSSTILRLEELRRSPGAYGDISLTLASLPGVSNTGISSDIIVRGGNPDENLILINGMEMSDPTHFPSKAGAGADVFMILDSQVVREIYFSAGGFSSEYGDKLSSIMDISLREGDSEEYETKIDVNMAGLSGLIEGPIGSRTNFYFTVRRSMIEIISKLFDVGEGLPVYTDLSGMYSIKTSKNGKLSLMVIRAWDEIYIERDPDEGLDVDIFWNSNQMGLGANYKHIIGDYGLVEVIPFYTTYNWNNYSEPLDWKWDLHEGIFALKSSYLHKLNGLGELKLGSDIRRVDIDYGYYYGEGYTDEGYHHPEIKRHLVNGGNKLAGFSELNLNLGKYLSMRIGGRIDYFGITDERKFSPRFGFSIIPTDKFTINGSYGIYRQFPGYYEIQSHPDNTDLQASKAFHYILGCDYLLTPETRIKVEGFYKDITKLPVYVDETDERAVSQGEGYSYGFEVSFDKRFSRGFWFKANYGYMVSKRNDNLGEGWFDNYYSQPHIITLQGGFRISMSMELSAKWRYATGLPYTPLIGRYIIPTQRYDGEEEWARIDGNKNSERTPSYQRLDVRFDKYFFFKGWNIITYVEGWNIYNHENISGYYYSTDYSKQNKMTGFGFIVSGGVSFEF